MKTEVCAEHAEPENSAPDSSENLREESPPPLGGYAGLIVTFAVVVSGFLGSRRHSLPEKMSWGDLLLVGLATQKVSRVVTKSRIGGVVRAPFTEFERPAGAGEV